VAERDGDRGDVRPLPPRHAIEVAHELREEVVWKQFRDDQLQERAGPGELRGAGGELPHRTRTKLRPPPLGIELLFRPDGVFQLTVDVGDQGMDLAHGSSSTSAGARERTRAGKCGGPGQSA